MDKLGMLKNKKEKLTRPNPFIKHKHIMQGTNGRLPSCQGKMQAIPASQPVSLPGELRRIWLSKDRLKEWCFIPFFHHTLNGCFVRVEVNGTSVERNYLVAEITDVVEMSKVYQIGSMQTNLGLVLRHGDVKQVFTMEFASNEEFTDREFLRWKEKLRVLRMKMPTLEQINKKQKAIMDALNHTFTEEQIERIIQEKNKFRTKSVNFAKRKIQLFSEMAAAEQNRDTSKIRAIREELEKTEEERRTINVPYNMKKEICYIPRSSDNELLDPSCKSTKPNQNITFSEALKNNDVQGLDPFTRRKTQPIMVSGRRDVSVRQRTSAVLDWQYGSSLVE